MYTKETVTLDWPEESTETLLKCSGPITDDHDGISQSAMTVTQCFGHLLTFLLRFFPPYFGQNPYCLILTFERCVLAVDSGHKGKI